MNTRLKKGIMAFVLIGLLAVGAHFSYITLLPQPAAAVGTMTFVYERSSPINRIVVSWTSTAGGAASGTTKKISGALFKGVTDPDGTAVPSDDYDIVLTGQQGVNILGLSGDDLIDRDTANNEEIYFNLATNTGSFPVVSEKITVTVAAAGGSKSGVLYIYWK